MTARIKKGAITGRPAYSNGGLGLSIGTRVNGGIRSAIAHRAPDSIKVVEEVTDTTPTYKLTSEIGEVALENVSTTTRTYLSNINFGYDTVGGGEPSLPLFEYPLANLNLTYQVASLGGAPIATYAFNFTTGEDEAIESLFTNQSKNN
jgi:hypothetical protein